MEYRLNQVEKEQAIVREQYSNLTKATEKNTSAIDNLTISVQKLVNTLSYNKGAIWMAFKAASLGTLITGAAFSIGTWIYGAFHAGK